ncbi:uncharacterized protein LOC129962937 [Argiope bruennichi]|uniref:uncharacterized protein LOC129962937 n=1 Tax=Argiope bruennichi TaxID=94029 RepID=UPI002495841D|nr:uncharacterized protein LOC129962937 [Argiope bruennichi]
MEGFKIATFLFVLWGCQLYTIQCCTEKFGFSGQIYEWTYYGYKRCWKISVPAGYFIRLQMVRMTSSLECEEDYVRINITGNSDELKLCSSGYYKNPITGFGNVTVTYSKQKDGSLTEIKLTYLIRTVECLNTKSFQCDDNFCISEEKVCNGVKDCINGNDESGCETGLQTIKEVPAVKNNAISCLKQKRSVFWGWKNKTPRAVVALYLASAASFNGSVLEEEFMAKQTEFEIAVSFLKSGVTNGELSTFINALLVTCHNPRQFYGNNLVKRLKDQVEESGNFTHPLAYLALCNANEAWPPKATSDLNSILSSDSEYPFVKDLQAMALIALSCEANHDRNASSLLSNTT